MKNPEKEIKKEEHCANSEPLEVAKAIKSPSSRLLAFRKQLFEPINQFFCLKGREFDQLVNPSCLVDSGLLNDDFAIIASVNIESVRFVHFVCWSHRLIVQTKLIKDKPISYEVFEDGYMVMSGCLPLTPNF